MPEFEVSRTKPIFQSLSRPLKVALLTTGIWIATSGAFVASHHDVPSMLEFKASRSEFSACGGNGSGMAGPGIQACLDAAHFLLVRGWKRDVGNIVVIPPLLAWAAFGALSVVRLRRRKAA